MGPQLTVLAVLAAVALCAGVHAESFVYNGSFDEAGVGGVPEGWHASGRSGVIQELTVVEDAERGRVAQLVCTAFVAGSPSSHAMLAQIDRVGVEKGKWYRLTLRARGSEIQGGLVQVALSNRSVWSNAGLMGSFVPPAAWEQFEFTFQGSQDLKPEDSRLQIWFSSTGTLWLDDVVLEPAQAIEREWLPKLPWAESANAIPNSSFECGGSGWGCAAEGIPGWGAQVFRLLGSPDTSRAFHGSTSWRLSLPEDVPDPLYFDYYNPIAARVRCLLLGHEGWVPTEEGGPYTFSAYVSADRPGVPVRVLVSEADGGRHQRTFTVGQDWQQVELTFTAKQSFAAGYVGLDLRESDEGSATLWVDAVQFERGPAATTYEPRAALESFVETGRTGSIFTDPAAGIDVTMRAYNNGPGEGEVRGTLTVTDYRDNETQNGRLQLVMGEGQSTETPVGPFVAGRQGFFRLRWEAEGGLPQDIRCAVIEPFGDGDSMFGMNHAFPSDFLLRLAHQAGIRWWRDWSIKWETVQPQPGPFDFSVPDAQIDRVLAADGLVQILLPFPSAIWATTVDKEMLDEFAGDNTYLRERLPTSLKPDRLEDWAAYVRASVEHYKGRSRIFEILNEPLYTSYAVPARFGHDVDDYVDLLRVAYQTAKEVDPDCLVMGGIGAGPDTDWLSKLIEKGGMQWMDLLNYHAYPHKGWSESYEPALQKRWEELKERGEAKPIWFTEFGLYADDDPPSFPYRAGDQTMNNTIRPNELAAACDMVRFAALYRAYGVAKIFYHAGTASALHRSSAGNIFFEYGGAPRKQYAAQAVLSRLMGPDAEFVRKWDDPEWVSAYEFRSGGRTVVVLWTRRADAPPLPVPEGLTALDLMGNTLPAGNVVPTDEPLYLVGE